MFTSPAVFVGRIKKIRENFQWFGEWDVKRGGVWGNTTKGLPMLPVVGGPIFLASRTRAGSPMMWTETGELSWEGQAN